MSRRGADPQPWGREAAFTKVRVERTSHLFGLVHGVMRRRRLNQMGGRPEEAMTGHERASTTLWIFITLQGRRDSRAGPEGRSNRA